MEALYLKIEQAVCDHINGPSTAKELTLDLSYSAEDEDGNFHARTQIHIPVPYNTVIGDYPYLRGRTLKISIE